MTTTTTNPYPDVRIPAGAVWAEWEDLGTSWAFRHFRGTERVIDAVDAKAGIGNEAVRVYIGGMQEPDGTSERYIVGALHADNPITPQQAVLLGRALMELGLEAQEMAEIDHEIATGTGEK